MADQYDKDIESIWIEYAKSRDVDLRNQIILRYSHLVKHIVNRLWGGYTHSNQADDWISCGIIGLIDAVERFDFSRGIKFETYAYFRIRGEIIDQIRKNDWLPKRVRIRAKKIEEAMAFMEGKLSRQPSDQEIANHLSIPIEELHRNMGEMHSFAVVTMDEHIIDYAMSTNTVASKSESPELSVADKEITEILATAIEGLAEKEKKIVSLYYYDQLNLKEIGMVMGVSESRVSQIHTRALMRLKSKLVRHKNLLFEEECV